MARIRAWLLTLMSLVSLMLLVGTAISPKWIEVFFAVEPDAGDGSAEAIVTLVFVATTIVSGVGAIVSWRRVRSQSILADR